MTKKESTEEKILQAAEEVFVEKGMSGARMQEIADTAGINKALLHYYYRSKQKLFRAVFRKVFPRFLPEVLQVLTRDMPFFEKIEKFTQTYIETMQRHPHVPLFVIHELSRNPDEFADTIMEVISDLNLNLVERFKREVAREIDNGTIIEIDYRHLFVNMISMCAFPVVGRPIVQRIGFENNQRDYDRFLEQRKTEVVKFIILAIKK
ncbi:MAG: TetR/AcrR family transcriptional regulator [bacterium]